MSSFSVTETPQAVFFPSLVVNFQIRLDEGADAPASTAPEDLAGDNATAAPLVSGPEPTLLKRGNDSLSQVLGIVPMSCSVELPGYRQAGTFSIDMAFRDLPLDPRVIRAVGVAIHLGTVTPQQFADGMTQIVPIGDSRFEDAQIRSSILQTSPENLVLAGLVDSIVAEHGDKLATIHMEGRDLRGVLLDTPISPKTLESMDLTKPIDEVVRHMVTNLFPGGGGIQVQVNTDEWPNGVPEPSSLDDATRVNLNAIGQAVKAKAKGEASEVSFWDFITNICLQVGGVPHFVGSVLRIRPARSLFDARRQEKQFDPRFATPFLDGEPRSLKQPFVSVPEQLAFRRITYGRDVRSMSFERKLGGVKVPVVEAVSWDSDTKKLVKARFPNTKKAQATSVPPGGGEAQTVPITIKVPGNKSKERLSEIARDVYHEVGRQEISGSIETKNLTSFGGGNQDPDLVSLRPGDPVEIRVDNSGLSTFPPPISPLSDSESRSFEQQVAELTERLGDEGLARALVTSNRNDSALTRTFRTTNVRYDWDSQAGLGIAFNFQNFVEARYDVDT